MASRDAGGGAEGGAGGAGGGAYGGAHAAAGTTTASTTTSATKFKFEPIDLAELPRAPQPRAQPHATAATMSSSARAGDAGRDDEGEAEHGEEGEDDEESPETRALRRHFPANFATRSTASSTSSSARSATASTSSSAASSSPVSAAAHAQYRRAPPPSTSSTSATSASASTNDDNNDSDSDSDSDSDFGPARPAHLVSSSSAAAASRDPTASLLATLPISHVACLSPGLEGTLTGVSSSSSSSSSSSPANNNSSGGAAIVGTAKCISALSFDAAGSRLVTGSYDYHMRLYDYNGMDERMVPFRTTEPLEANPLHHVRFSASGDMIVVCSTSWSVKVCSRDARELATSAKGDMYLHDQKRTKGHIAQVTSCGWHPRTRGLVYTASLDGTVRFWNVDDMSASVDCVKLRGVMRGVGITACAYAGDASLLAAATSDGALRLLREDSSEKMRDDKVALGAHANKTCTSALMFAPDNTTLISRGGDHTMKVWDVRQFRTPIHVIDALPNEYEQTDMCFSPKHDVLVTVTSVPSAAEEGRVHFYAYPTCALLAAVPLGIPATARTRSAVRVAWHPTLNQIAVACSDGVVRQLYDPERSTRGVLMCVGRRSTRRDGSADHLGGVATDLNALAVDMTAQRRGAKAVAAAASSAAAASAGEASAGSSSSSSSGISALNPYGSRKRQLEKARQDPVLTKMPALPLKQGVGGRLSTATSMTQQLLSSMIQRREDPRAVDPREALLAMDEKVRANPIYSLAYAKTQPKPIFAEYEDEEEEEGGSGGA